MAGFILGGWYISCTSPSLEFGFHSINWLNKDFSFISPKAKKPNNLNKTINNLLLTVRIEYISERKEMDEQILIINFPDKKNTLR